MDPCGASVGPSRSPGSDRTLYHLALWCIITFRSYLGEKKVLSLGFGFDAQNGLTLSGSEDRDNRVWTADVFMDHPIGDGAETVEAAYIHNKNCTQTHNFSELTARDLKVTALVDSMDHLAYPGNTGFPLFDHFEKFTAAKLIRSTKKRQTPPCHPFFDLCDIVFEQGQRLNDEMAQYLLFLKTRLFAFAASELGKRKKEKNR